MHWTRWMCALSLDAALPHHPGVCTSVGPIVRIDEAGKACLLPGLFHHWGRERLSRRMQCLSVSKPELDYCRHRPLAKRARIVTRSTSRPVVAGGKVYIDPIQKQCTAFAPATVANLGPGFDWLGCAVEVRTCQSTTVTVKPRAHGLVWMVAGRRGHGGCKGATQ
jgi:hypothetical protein